MKILFGIIVFILGLCFGSFVNMLVYRTAIEYELKSPPSPRLRKGEKRSFCDYCGRQLKWYENVPVISWLIQRGKTRCCNKKLSISYPIVELMMGILFVLFYFVFGFDSVETLQATSLLRLILGFIIIVFLIFSLVFDLKYMILPDFSTVILIVLAFILLLLNHVMLALYILSALISAGFLLILNLITKGNGMGMGDVKLAIFIGLFLGFPNTVVAFYIAFIVGAIFGLILMIFKKETKKSQIPFGPFMILGTLTAWWWGEKIVELVRL